MIDCDVLLIGAGVMSATVGTLLKELDPSLEVVVLERLDRVAGESSEARNNAGTGHSALCEINYTPRAADGSIDVRKAVKVMECFEVSRQLWSYLARRPGFSDPRSFVRSVPHMSFVWGDEDVEFLRQRFQALSDCHLFHGMRYSEIAEDVAEWMPLVMQARDAQQRVAATRSELGTDVDFGALTRAMFDHLLCTHGVGVSFGHEVTSLARDASGRWIAEADAPDGREVRVRAKFVFIGAGGAALTLLDRSDIPEGEGYGGFPVSGEWLVCTNPDLIARHHGKVYGKARVGAPPMSMPHLDTRFIDGKRALMFGPFAGFSTRFLKEGSFLDLPLSITADNIRPMLSAGLQNLPLTRYLIGQVTQSFEDKVEALLEYVPYAQPEDWQLSVAGQRVQVIKKDGGGGKLEFGTEIISAKDNSLAALLGASPGASTAVSIALDLLVDCFPERMESAAWQRKLSAMIPSYGRKLADDRELAKRVRAESQAALGLTGR